MITIEDYFGKWLHHADATPERMQAAEAMLAKVNSLLDAAFEDGVDFVLNPNTHSLIAGQTLGGFRPQQSTVGAPNSAHKQGRAVDVYDPANALDDWCMKHVAYLKSHGLYLEHPSATPKWCHLGDRPPGNPPDPNKTVFYP